MKSAIYCALICAVIGFAFALIFVATLRMSPILAYILCPPGIVARLTMTDPRPGPASVLFFFGPVNALIYGAVGFKLWLLIVGDTDHRAARKKVAG